MMNETYIDEFVITPLGGKVPITHDKPTLFQTTVDWWQKKRGKWHHYSQRYIWHKLFPAKLFGYLDGKWRVIIWRS